MERQPTIFEALAKKMRQPAILAGHPLHKVGSSRIDSYRPQAKRQQSSPHTPCDEPTTRAIRLFRKVGYSRIDSDWHPLRETTVNNRQPR
ncbi:hypothetical protein BGE01nite_31230 [Brevifollis gellanilyticus]|uniref:Uncharacterized protein n=1 Tax=Brevifollis gellanilyticus TaxID=748831 RepID=A0A512MAR8_9BACT|nr:hypothetical protein BGE01nite_31230 [Brevifollis gellanilyticus]